MSQSIPVARVNRQQQIQSRVSGLARVLGAANGALAVAAPASGATDDQQATSAELWLYGVIGGYWFGFNDKSVADQLRGLNVDHITVRLNSPGGSVVQAIAIGNLLRNHKARVTVVIDGLAASAAPLIAIAGDEIIMSPGSQVMLHDPWMFTVGNAKELRWDAGFLDKQGANLAATLATRSGTTEAWRAAMTAEPDGTWYTAEETVAANLADRIGTVVAISAAPEPPVVDGDDEDDDIAAMAARAAWDLDVLIAPTVRATWQDSGFAPQAEKATTNPPTAPADGTTNTEGGSAVAFSDEQMTNLRGTLGLAESADETAIVAAINAVVEDSLEETPPSTPQIPEGMALVDSAVLAELQAGATAGRTALAVQATQERDREIGAALAAGKIAATSREQFEAAWDKNPTGTKAILDVLTPGLVPTAEVGHESEPNGLGDIELEDAELDAFAASLGMTKEALRG